MLGDIILAEPGALIGFAGPRVIEQTIGQKLPEGFQRSEFLQDHGFVDKIVKREEMKDAISAILKLHRSPNQEQNGENSFFHVDNCGKSEAASGKEKKMCIRDRDNGGGMTEERYLQVMEHLASREYPDDHVGLYNVNRTLQLTYGEKYGIRLENRSGDGLTVFIEIPAQKS